MKPQVVWFNTARSPYNDYLFRNLAKVVNLIVFSRFAAVSSHPWSLPRPDYDCRDLRGNLISAVREARQSELVVIGGWDSKRFLLVSLLTLGKGRLALWTDTPNVRRRGPAHRMLRALVLRYVFSRCDRLWATGRPGCEALEDLGCPPQKLDSLPFFLESASSNQPPDRTIVADFRARHGAANRVVLLCVGRLIPSKRFEDAITAMTRIDSQAILWIVGSGEEGPRLAHLVESLGLAKRVRLLGWLQPADVALAVRACDIFVHPAETDPFPTVVLDAMAHSRPVVGTRTSGSVADRVVDGWNGFVVPPKSPDILAARIDELVHSSERRRQLGTQAGVTAARYRVAEGLRLIVEAMEARTTRTEGGWRDRYPKPRADSDSMDLQVV